MKGSIVVTFVIAGTLSSVNSTAHIMCISNDTCYSHNGYSLTLSTCMTINNQIYNGVTCDIEKNPLFYLERTDKCWRSPRRAFVFYDDDDDSETLAPYLIAVIVILAILLFVAIVVVVVWRISLAKAKKHAEERQGNHYYGNKKAEDVFFREDTCTSLKFREDSTCAAPVSTNIGEINKLQTEELLTRNGNLEHVAAPVLVSARSPRYVNVKVARLTELFEPSKPTPTLFRTDPCAGSVNRENSTPVIQRNHTPFRECESPMPAVFNQVGQEF